MAAVENLLAERPFTRQAFSEMDSRPPIKRAPRPPICGKQQLFHRLHGYSGVDFFDRAYLSGVRAAWASRSRAAEPCADVR